VTALLSLPFAGCDFSDYDFLHGNELTFDYSAVDSTGYEVVTGTLKLKFDFRSYGCSSSQCGDIDGSWDFTASVTPPLAPHPVGSGSLKGVITKEWGARIPIGPDRRGHSIVLEFELPPEDETPGTWSAATGQGRVIMLRER
jgi:hypothetical protein